MGDSEKVFKPSELRKFLDSLGVRAKKSLSQNFLVDGNILNKIADAAALSPGDVVVEIGPGPGALTQELLERGATVLAIEKDNVFAEALSRLATEDGRLHIFNDDILTFPLEETLSDYLPGDKKAKAVANIPYHLTGAILTKLVLMEEVFSSLVFMVQDEVARRVTASPRCKEYGSLSVFLQFHAAVRYAFGISSTCFHPQPKVDSAVVSLELKPTPTVSSKEAFLGMVRTAFGQRRKMLRSSLRKLYSSESVTKALEDNALNPLARPEDLSLEEFLRFFEKL